MRTRRKPHCRLLAAVLAAGLLAGCSLPALKWMPSPPGSSPAQDAPAAPAPGPADARPLVVLLGEDTNARDGFSALLAAYTESQGTEARLLQPGDPDADGAGLVLLARRPEPSGWVDLAAEPLLGVLAQGAAALPCPASQNLPSGCPALPLGFAGYGYLADSALLKALLGDGFDPALLAGADWAEWKGFVETLGGWIKAPAEWEVTLAGRTFTLPAEKPDAAQNLAGVFAPRAFGSAPPPAGPLDYAGSAFSPALAAAGGAGESAELFTGPLNGVWAGFQLEQAWAAVPSGPPSAALGGETPDGNAGAQGQPADEDEQSGAALLESGRAVFCRAMTGGLNGCSAEFRSRLLLLPFKATFDETDLAPDSAFSLEALNGWPVLGTPGWLAIPAGASPEQRALAEGFLLWLFASAGGQQALEDTMGALSIAGTTEPHSPAMQAVADAVRTGQALPDLAEGFSPQAHARANAAFAETAGASDSAARRAWIAAVLEALAGG